MLPVRLEIKNFLAYRETVALSFEGIHLACLTGPNGAGKSSVLDAITWALWGEARGARADELMHLNEQDMHVQLDFLHEGTTYRVLRKRARKGAGSTTLDLYAQLDDGSWNAIGEASVRATQAKISDLLRLDHATFTHSAFLQQGKADSFVSLAPAERKNTLAEILGIHRFQAYEKAAREQAREADNHIAVLTLQLADIEQQLSREPELAAAVREAEARYETTRAALDEADARLREVEHVPQAVKDARANAAETQTRLNNARRQLEDAARRVAEARAEVAARESALDRRETVEAGYQELQQARSENQALGEKFERFAHLREQIRDLETEIGKRRAAIEQQIAKLDAQITAAENTMRQADPEAHARARDEAGQLTAAEAALKVCADTIAARDTERSACDSTNKHLKVDMDKMAARRDNLKEIEGASCPLCGQPLDEAHRAQLLDEITADGTDLGNTFRANKTRMAEIDAELGELRAARKQHEADIKRLQGSIKALAQFDERQQRAQAAETERDQCAAERNALQTDLKAGGYAAELTERAAALQQERDALGYDQNLHTDTKRRLSEYEAFEQAHSELEKAEAALPGAQRALEAATQNETLYQGAVENETAALSSAQARLTELEALLGEFQLRHRAAEDLRRREREAHDSLRAAQQELNALDGLRARQSDLSEQLAAKKVQRGIYEELTAAFGKNGIPAMLIETAIPEIEEEANALLWQMTSGRMTIRITTQREKVAGGTIETLDFLVADDLGQRPYDTFSGGEAFRINFALRVALSQLLARRAGAHLRALFLDEGFGTQDEDGRTRLVEAITAVKDRFDLILVITHIEELRDHFPVHLQVTKTETGSRIAIR